jgi:hypothetical protein
MLHTACAGSTQVDGILVMIALPSTATYGGVAFIAQRRAGLPACHQQDAAAQDPAAVAGYMASDAHTIAPVMVPSFPLAEGRLPSTASNLQTTLEGLAGGFEWAPSLIGMNKALQPTAATTGRAAPVTHRRPAPHSYPGWQPLGTTCCCLWSKPYLQEQVEARPQAGSWLHAGRPHA